ncbi:MAG: hypothetical protein LBS64_04420 [Spirochaetaceae bacterium]|jgi:hypothetical protein|nr:hypothetical protein [Spirochaetaceae bacterium]
MKTRGFWFIFWLLLLCCLGAAGFFVGWVQYAVPAGRYGVLETKTNGVLRETFAAGKIDWRWQRLIPKNAEVLVFPVFYTAQETTVSGMLPSGVLYSSLFAKRPDFSYSFTIAGTVKIRPESLPALVEQGLRTEEDMSAHVAQKNSEIASAAALILLSGETPLADLRAAFDTQTLRTTLAQNPAFSTLEIESLTVRDIKMPDLEIYNQAKESFQAYRQELDQAIQAAANSQAAALIRNTAALEHLDKLGALFEKYPHLLDVFKGSGDISDILKELGTAEM